MLDVPVRAKSSVVRLEDKCDRKTKAESANQSTQAKQWAIGESRLLRQTWRIQNSKLFALLPAKQVPCYLCIALFLQEVVVNIQGRLVIPCKSLILLRDRRS